MADIDEKEVRRIIDCEIEKLKDLISDKEEFGHEKINAITKGLKEEINHKFTENKERILDEAKARERDVEGIYGNMKHKWDFVKWITSGIFGTMAVMAGAFYGLINTGDQRLISELCRQGTLLHEMAKSGDNKILGYINSLGHNFEYVSNGIIPNCSVI